MDFSISSISVPAADIIHHPIKKPFLWDTPKTFLQKGQKCRYRRPSIPVNSRNQTNLS